MANRLIISHSVAESMVHISVPITTQVTKAIVDRMGYHDLMGTNIDIKSDFVDWTKTKDNNSAAATRGNRVRVKFNPNVNLSTIKWEGSGTTKELANGNTLVQNRNGASVGQRMPWLLGAHMSKRRYSIMCDDEIGVDLSDRMVGSSMTMEVTMEFEDEFLATEALTRLFQCYTNGDMINYIDIMYDYPVPEQFIYLTKYLYHLKCMTPSNPDGAFQLIGGKKKYKIQEWYEWLKKYSNETISVLFNRNRTEHKELVVNKNHFQALYLIECSQESPAPLEPAGASITFNVVIQFARANTMVLEYPVIINNNFVDPKMVPLERKIRAAGPETMIMWQNSAFTKYWHDTYTTWPPSAVKFPYYDPWEVPIDSCAWMNGYRPVLIAAFTVDDPANKDGDTRFDFDVDPARALESVIDKDILDCIREKKNKVFGVDEFVNITVFADDVAIRPNGDEHLLDISDGHTLIIRNRRTLPVYRMVLSIGKPIRSQAWHWNRVWIASITTHPDKKG